MKPVVSDTSPSAEQVQIELFRRASPGRKLSLVRSLSRTTIELSRRTMTGRFVAVTYGLDLPFPEDRTKAPPDLIAALVPVIDLFEQWQIDYFIGGSIAGSAHGVPRATVDIDLIATLPEKSIQPLVENLQTDYYVDETAIRRAIANRGSFNLIHLATMLKLDVFIQGSGDYDEEEARRAIQIPLEDDPQARKFFVASAEDMVIAKLDWYRRGGEISEKQWSDILGILKVQGENLDFDYLKRWAKRKNLSDLLLRARDEAQSGAP